MSEQRQQPDPNRAGSTDHPQHRTPPGEGKDAPLAEESGGPAEMSIFDGAGNEISTVLTEDEEGRPSQGTGPDRESALKDAKDPGDYLGGGFTTGEHGSSTS